jgi:hypothetical protein
MSPANDPGLPMLRNLESFVDLGHRDGVDTRPALLRVLTDLYVQKPVHDPDEERHYAELALRLIEAVDTATKQGVARTLARYGRAPAAVLARLAQDCDDAAELLRAAPSGITAESGELTHLSGRGGAAAELTELFFGAGAAERRTILINLEYVAPDVLGTTTPPDGLDACRRLEQAALQRKFTEFTRELGRTLRVSQALANRIAQDNFGEPLVVAAKASGMPVEVLQRILLVLNPAIGQSVPRIYDLTRLFEEIKPGVAMHLAAIWREAAPERPRHALYRPLLEDDRAGRSPRAASVTTTRATPPLPERKRADPSGS